MGGREVTFLKAMVGQECCIGRRGAKLNSGGIQNGMHQHVEAAVDWCRTQIFATADHNNNRFLKIATFLQNQFTKNLICDLISQLIFKLSTTN